MASIRVEQIRATHEWRSGPSNVRDSAHAAGKWLVRLARGGYAAKGILYLVIGALAALATLGSRAKTTDSHGALNVIGASAFGRILLLVMGVGLVAYALWAVISSALDAERRGRAAKAVALRIGLAARALAYGALGVEAIRLFVTARASDGNGEEHWTGRLLAMPMGQWIVGGVGVAVISYALYQFWRAARKNLRKRLHLAEAGPAASRWVVRLARFGIAMRGVVFVLIGWLLVQAAVRYDPNRAGGIDESLNTLAAQPYGTVLLAVVACGLMAYGIWELANARYREMRVS